jgi:hypothetical protein
MEKVLHFDSPAPVYRADACVITCYDARFDAALKKFFKRRGLAIYDQMKLAGSAKALAAPASEEEKEFVLGMVRTSVRLHGSPLTLIIGHNDCGAYEGRPAEEIAADVVQAAQVVRTGVPGMAVECYFADFDGVYRL